MNHMVDERKCNYHWPSHGLVGIVLVPKFVVSGSISGWCTLESSNVPKFSDVLGAGYSTGRDKYALFATFFPEKVCT
jgi:hypothetical protein